MPTILDPKRLTRDALNELGAAAAAQILATLKKKVPNAKTTDAITYSIDSRGDIVVHIVEYLAYVDTGRRPVRVAGSSGKKVPIVNILRFIDKAGLTPSAAIGGGKNGLAFAIQKSIANRGIKAKPFIKKGLYKFYKDDFDAIISDHLNKALDQILPDHDTSK